MNVLYLDHTSLVSGAQRALLDIISGLPADVHPTVMCPEGQLAEMVRSLNVSVIPFKGTASSLRLHPWHTTHAGVDIARSAIGLKTAAQASDADVVHANSIRAGLIAGVARRAGNVPTVVHIHDALPPSRSADLVRAAVNSTADAIITISDYTTENFAGGRATEKYRMLENPLDVARFDPATITRADARARLGLGLNDKVIGLVAQITPWKGQDTAIRAVAMLQARHPEAKLLLVGDTKFVSKATRYDNLNYEAWLRKLTAALGLEANVEFWPEREDIVTVMRALDVLVAPSWEEPFGRSVIEAMALETAVVATNVGGPAEYVDHEHDGLLASPFEPREWAVALDRLLSDPALSAAYASRARTKSIERFDRGRYVSRTLDVYRDAVSG